MADTFDDVKGSTLQGSPVENHRSTSASSTDANVTLWQFLLDLLLKQQYSNIICWTNNEGEFKLLDAEQVAKLWGHKKNKNNMTYDKLSRALRYYYDKNIIKKVMGQKFVYKFVSFPEMVKTENRIPFKKKMESIVNDSMPNSAVPKVESSIATASSFQTLRPYDVKAGLIQHAQLAAQLQALQQAHQADYMAKYQSRNEEQNRLSINPDRLSVSPHMQIKTEALSPGSSYSSHGEAASASIPGVPAMPQPLTMSGDEMEDKSSDVPFSKSTNPHLVPSHSSTQNSIHVTHQNGGLLQVASQANGFRMNGFHHSLHPGIPTDLSMKRSSATASPLNVCTPNPSPPPAHGFEIPRSATPTPPPVTKSPSGDSEVIIKLEIPELDGSSKRSNASEKRTLKHQRSKPEPISISNDVPPPGPIVYSPHRHLLPSLNTPMFMNSPLFSSRTPLLNGLPFWSGAGISPVHTLSPHLPGGLQAPSAFQFPSFAVSPATLASFSQWTDSVFANTATPSTSLSSEERKFFPSTTSK